MDKYLYFRAVDDEDADDGDGASGGVNPTSIAIPTRNITGIGPGSDASVVIKFLSVRNQGPRGGQAGAAGDEIIQDTITLAVNIGAMNDVHSDGFIDVCDDVVTNFANETITAVRLHSDISTGVGDTGISVAAAM